MDYFEIACACGYLADTLTGPLSPLAPLAKLSDSQGSGRWAEGISDLNISLARRERPNLALINNIILHELYT